jgi:hypothetical protein
MDQDQLAFHRERKKRFDRDPSAPLAAQRAKEEEYRQKKKESDLRDADKRYERYRRQGS